LPPVEAGNSTEQAPIQFDVSQTQAPSIHEIELPMLNGKAASLAAYAGKVILAVNTASKCGFTPQYGGLQALQDRYSAKGFTVLGFPCNQFFRQEPGTAEDIQSFCSINYGVTFPMFAKLDVKGANQHPAVRDPEPIPRRSRQGRQCGMELREVSGRQGRARGPPFPFKGRARIPGGREGDRVAAISHPRR